MRRFLSLLLIVCFICSGAPALAEGVVTPSEPDPSAQGWISLEDGGRLYGDIEDLLMTLQGRGEIFVQEKRAAEIKDIAAPLLSEVEFLPDPDAFADGEYIVRVTYEDPDEAEDIAQIEDIDVSDFADDPERTVTVYIWVMQIIEEQPTEEPAPTPEPTPLPLPAPVPTPEPTPEPEKIVIGVAEEGFMQGEWSSAAPVFRLSGIPEGRTDLGYAVILYDRQITEIEGESYIPQDEGVFALRFAIMDQMGDIVSASESFTLYLDLSAPESVSAVPSQQKSYAMILTASDSLSGAKQFSTDGGSTWEEIGDGQSMGYVFGEETVLEPGMLCVMDGAGNIWKNEEPLTFGAVIKESYGGGYGGPSKPHSENTSGNDGGTGYDQAYLFAPEEPVAEIALTGRQLLLSADETEGALFTMAFGKWAPEDEGGGLSGLHAGEKGLEDDMLVLTAEPVEKVEGEQTEYTWKFDGAALRTLYATGVDMLVLRAGDAAAVLPMAGFTAGTRYTDLKIGGTGSRYFLYSAKMTLAKENETLLPNEINRTESCLFTLDVSVKDEQFSLVPAQGLEMYTEGVYCIPQEWIGLSQEEWPQTDAE